MAELLPIRSVEISDSEASTKRANTLVPVPEPLAVALYDNHTHLDISMAEELTPAKQLELAESAGVQGIVQVGTDLETSIWSAQLAAEDKRVLAAVALHPNEAPKVAALGKLEEQIEALAELAGQTRVRAIGETGLDFFRTGADGIDSQRKAFEDHIDLARQFNLALQIHDRDAHREVVETVNRVGDPDRVVLHCFSGDREFAELAVARGWYLSFAGTVTFKNAENLRDALRVTPLSRILIETDAPFLTPAPHRGKINSAYLIPYTLRFMAEVLAMDEGELAAEIAANTVRVYGSWN